MTEMAMLCSPLSRLKMLVSMSDLVNGSQRSRTFDFPCATITWSVPIEIVSQSVDDAPDVQADQVRDAAQIPADAPVPDVVACADHSHVISLWAVTLPHSRDPGPPDRARSPNILPLML